MSGSLVCPCIQRVVYCLRCADIPTNIFYRYECHKHKDGSANFLDYVECYLLPDELLTHTEDMNNWESTYHGTNVNAVVSILQHGEMLMEGDVRWDGSYLEARAARAANQPRAIFNYPSIQGADNRTVEATYDNKETRFKIVLQLRQMKSSYETAMTIWGYEMCVTDRRGTIMLEALNVCVLAAKGQAFPNTVRLNPTRLFFGLFACPVQMAAYNFLKILNIPEQMFEGLHNRCYCESCFPDKLSQYLEIAGEKYVIPRGWTRFALVVNPVFARVNDIWDAWNMAFHGCQPKNLLSILKHRSLLIPNDILSNGERLGVCASRDKNQKNYFLSPSIGYSAHPWYSKPMEYTDSSGEKRYAQTVLVFKVRPGTFDKQGETEGGAMVGYDDYSIIPENEIEWYSSRRGSTHPYGLLVRTMSASQFSAMMKKFTP